MKRLLKTSLALVAAGGALFASSSAFAGAFPAPYCERGYGNGVEPITSVDIDGIHNTSSATLDGTPADEDFTTVFGQLAPGGSYPVSVQGNTGGNFGTAIAVYIDWDQSGTFETPAESYLIGRLLNSTGADGKTVGSVISVPAGATPGQTRMRVAKQYSSNAAPTLADVLACGTTGFGQAEDYTINIDPAAPVPPSLAMAFTPTNGPAGATSTLTLSLGNTMTSVNALTADFTNTLPTGLLVAAEPNASASCAGGALAASAGGSTITLTSGTGIPAGGCAITVDVSAASAGIYVNTVAAGALMTASGAGPAASATYQATADGIVTYGTGFESPAYVVGNLNAQAGWYGSVAADWKVATAHPGTGIQHVRGTWTTAGSGTSFMLSPTQAMGTTDYSVASAKLAITVAGTGATWDFAAQDTVAGSVITRVRFLKDAGNKIQVLDPNGSGPGVSGYVDTGATWSGGGAFFDVKLIARRSDNTYVVCLDGTQIHSGTGFAGSINNIAIIGNKGTGTQNNLLDVDDVTIDNTNVGTCDGSAPLVAPSAATSFTPASVEVNVDSTATITLSNANATVATLTSDLLDTLPAGLVASAASTTCGGTASFTAGTLTLASGATIPANGSCTLTGTVQSATAGSYVNTIAAGALQTDAGSNATEATATLTVTDGGGGDDLVCSGSVNHEIPADFDGTYINWIAGIFSDGDTTPDYHFNPYGATSLSFYWGPNTRNAGVATATGTTWSVLQPGDSIGATSIFSRATGPATNWLEASIDGYLGFSLDCSTLSPAPASGICYGYAHMTTAGAGGIPATVVDYCYDKAGNTITIAGGTGPVAPTVSKAFTPASVEVDTDSTATVTLTNANAIAATLTADLLDTLPAGLVASAANTTCGGTASFTAGTLSLASGATIPANGSCTLTGTVQSATAGSYVNTIAAGALQTDAGNNAAEATATLTVTDGGGGSNGVITSGPLGHAIMATTLGTSMNIVTSAFDDGGPTSGDWDFNFWASSGNLTAYYIATHHIAYVVDGSGKAMLLQNGDVIDASSTFSVSPPASVPMAAEWLAGANGALGVKFDCDGRLPFPVPGTVCYGYIHLTTTGATGFPATIMDTAFDGDGNAITVTGLVENNPPSATVTPASLSFSVAANATATQTLDIANAAGSDALTYAIEARGASAHPVLRPHTSANPAAMARDGSQSNPDLASKLAELQRHAGLTMGNRRLASNAAPWAPTGSIQFVLDDGSYENNIGWGDNTVDPTTENSAVWVNRFTATAALTVDSVSIMWPQNNDGTLVGKQVNIVAYYDADGDGNPVNSVRLGTDNLQTIASLDAFITYTTNFSVPGAGDVYIGFFNTYANGTTSPELFPAAIDTNTSAGNSWIGANNTGDGNLDFGANEALGTIGGLSGGSLDGNWLIRATGTDGGAGGSCTGPVVSWLTAAPAGGSVVGGASASVTVTANPAAGGLAAGNYTGELCVTTNDPTQALIAVPVTLTVTEAPFVACSGADEIFCDGFDGAGGSEDVVTGVINQPAVADGNGSSFDFALGDFHGYSSSITTDDINLYTLGAPAISVYWYGDAVPAEFSGLVGGVVGTPGGTDFVVLQSGATIGAASPVSAASSGADMSAFQAGVDGYIGVAFYNETTAAVNYGYLHVTTAAGGFPIQVLDYGYDSSGADITIP